MQKLIIKFIFIFILVDILYASIINIQEIIGPLGESWTQSLMCAVVKHCLELLAPGWVTTWAFSDGSSPHLLACCSKPTVTTT